jgi:hypothetical protein
MANAQVIVEYIAKTEGLSKATGQIEQGGGRISKTMRGVATAVGTGLAIGAVVSFGKSAVSAAQDSEKATSRLEAVFKAMGDTTGEAAAAAEEYASTLSKQIGVEDDVILGAQAILATFGKVSDETARQAGVFDRATAAAADLAAAGFGTMESNAVALGKALQDPEKGITALARSGVTFTEAQKDQIKALQDSGKHLEAQKIVLAAIEGQVKGTAAATTNESEKMAVAYGEVQESVGKALLPILERLAPVVAKVADFIAKNSDVIVPLIGAVIAAAAAIKIITAAQILWNLAVSLNPIGAIILGIVALIAIIVLLIKNWDKVSAALEAVWDTIKDTALKVINWLKDNWPLLLPILLGPIGLAAAAIIKNWDTIKDGVQAMFDWFKSNWPLLVGILLGPVGLAAVGIIKHWDDIKDAVGKMATAVKEFFDGLVTFFTNLGARIGTAFATAKTQLAKPGEWVADAVSAAKKAFGDLVSFITDLGGKLATAFANVKNWLLKPGEWVEDAIKAGKEAFRDLITFITGLGEKLSSAFSQVKTQLAKPGEWVQDAVNVAKDAFKSLLDFIRDLPSKLSSAMSKVADAIKKPINAVLSAWNSLSFTVPEITIPGFGGLTVLGKEIIPGWGDIHLGGGTFPFPDVPLLAKGGIVSSPTLAVVGEAGREIIAPEALLRSIINERPLEVRVFIGERELEDMVRAEVRAEDTRTAQTLLAGLT